MNKKNLNWKASNWQNCQIIKQIPIYEDLACLNKIKNELKNDDSIVLLDEIQKLKTILINVENKNGFFVQAGYCAEDFKNSNDKNIKKIFKVFEQIKETLEDSTNKEITVIGRIAGQFAKPRTEEYEILNGKKILQYKGDMVNKIKKTEEDRKADPKRIKKAYLKSLNTMEIINNLSQSSKILNKLYVSHEALLLHYEEGLVRYNDNEAFLSSTHLAWLGIRTCEANSAHVEFLRGIINPIGIKCGVIVKVDELEEIIKRLNPNNEKGKIVLISRMGVGNSEQYLKPIIDMVRKNKYNVIWCCDPTHGNTKKLKNGLKTRYISDILQELNEFFILCKSENIYPGGIHLEITGENVTECIGCSVTENNLNKNYKTLCDPCLNPEQTINIIKKLAKIII